MELSNFRHGDVALFGIAQLPPDAVRVDTEGDIILALGEVTGHAHRIKQSRRVSLWQAAGQRYVTVEADPDGGEAAALDHEDHGHIPIVTGTYLVQIQRVYAPEGVRPVAD